MNKNFEAAKQNILENLAKVKPLDDGFNCSECNSIVYGPIECNDCGECFCRSCIEKLENKQCPKCHQGDENNIDKNFGKIHPKV